MKDIIKKIYGSIAKGKKKSCCQTIASCCSASNVSQKMDYSKKELNSIPKDADMGLGCGNPVALASLQKGETVVDLGSGGGIDAFLAAKRVGDEGRVIGIDMTEEMVKKAEKNTKKSGLKNVEFKLGDIENIPLQDNIADCIISNCVINLASDKQRVFDEAFRISKPNGRLMVSDMVIIKDLPEKVLKSVEMHVGCIAGALKKEEYLNKIRSSGFSDVTVIKEDAIHLLHYIGSDKIVSDLVKGMSENEINSISNAVVSIKISARKP